VSSRGLVAIISVIVWVATIAWGAELKPPQLSQLWRTELAELSNHIRAAQWPAALVRIEAMSMWIGKEMPITVRKAVVVNHDHRALGVYEAAPGGQIVGQRLRVYVEVDGIVQEPVAGTEPSWRSTIVVEGEFFAMGDEVNRIGRMSLGQHDQKTTDARPRTSFTTDIQLAKETPSGRYQVILHLRSGDKTTSVPVDFIIPS
jgi:hypothetical protein